MKIDNESSENARKAVGRHIQRLRKFRGITQAEMATACHISHSYVSKIEQGLVPLSQMIIKDMAAAMKLDPSALTPTDPGSTAVAQSAAVEVRPVAMPPREDYMIRRSTVLRAVNAGECVSIPVVTSVQAMSYDKNEMALDEFLGSVDGEIMDARPSCRYTALFGVEVRGTSMCPDYPPGTLLYVDGGQFAERGDLVVAKIEDENEIVVKEYGRRQNIVTLSSRNPGGREWKFDLRDPQCKLRWMFPVLEARIPLRAQRWQAR